MFRKAILGLTLLIVSSLLVVQPVRAQELKEQIVTDLVTVGITGAATLTGNIPLAMASGVLAKYISTYGVQGVKALINKFKAESPQDLGEINIYYIYLIHIKRNLYQSLINIRSNVKEDQTLSTINKEIEKLENDLSGNCSLQKCEMNKLDERLVNFEFMNMALDAKQSFDIFTYISLQEVKATYQYLMLLYLDVIIVEQKLLEGQYNVMASQVAELIENLEKNIYTSNEEKEYAYQLGMNIVLKWQKQRDHRRTLLLTVLKNPLAEMKEENEQIESDLERYRDINGQLRKMHGF